MMFCDNHYMAKEGRVCIAHLAEGRVFNCTFKTEDDMKESKNKCQDYSPIKEKTC